MSCNKHVLCPLFALVQMQDVPLPLVPDYTAFHTELTRASAEHSTAADAKHTRKNNKKLRPD